MFEIAAKHKPTLNEGEELQGTIDFI